MFCERITPKKIGPLLLAIMVLSAACAHAADWPQWDGPNRDRKSTEVDLLKKWPEQGPELLWSVDGLGEGFSSVSIVNGTIYTTGKIEKQLVLFAIDTKGSHKWKRNCGPAWEKPHPGARTTPTFDNDCLYLITGKGKVVCVDANTTKIKWSVNTIERFQAKPGQWGIAESLLIDGNNVICTPGGKDATIVALDKNTGDTIWQSIGLSEVSAYCSPILVERGGRRLIVTMTAKSTVAVDADSGKLLWRIPGKFYKDKPREINPNTPLYYDDSIYVTTGHLGGIKLKLSEDGSKVEQAWEDPNLDCYHGGVVLVDGNIYGSTYDGSWASIRWSDGKLNYKQKWLGKGAILYADSMLYCYEEKKGTFALVTATPDSFDIVSSFEVKMGTAEHWAHPVICNGNLYIRHGDTLMAYDIKKLSLSAD